MLSKHWDHPSVYNMIMKLLITRGPITLVPKEATQDKTILIINFQYLMMTNNSYSYKRGAKGFYQWLKSFVSCSHMNCCLQKHRSTTHQFTYFIYYSHEDKFKNSRIIKIHQVHQKLQTKMFYYFVKLVFFSHLNFK